MWIIVILIALVAPARADATWAEVAALAKPTAKRGPSKELARAMAIAAKQDQAWSDVRYKGVGLSGYPEGAAALAALTAWRKDGGGLPPEATPMERSQRGFQMMHLAQLAIDTADAEHRANLEVAMYLADAMVEDGENLLVVTAATSLFDDAKHKAEKLAVPSDKWPAPRYELVRIFAAEALSQKAAAEWGHTPAGKQAMRDPKTMPVAIPTDAQWASEAGFFLKALDGAKRGEPADATFARAQAAASGDPIGEMFAQMLKRLRDRAIAP